MCSIGAAADHLQTGQDAATAAEKQVAGQVESLQADLKGLSLYARLLNSCWKSGLAGMLPFLLGSSYALVKQPTELACASMHSVQCRCSTAAQLPAKAHRQQAVQAALPAAAHLKQSLPGGLPSIGAASSGILGRLLGCANGSCNTLLQGLKAGTNVGADHTLYQLAAPAVGQAG